MEERPVHSANTAVKRGDDSLVKHTERFTGLESEATRGEAKAYASRKREVSLRPERARALWRVDESRERARRCPLAARFAPHDMRSAHRARRSDQGRQPQARRCACANSQGAEAPARESPERCGLRCDYDTPIRGRRRSPRARTTCGCERGYTETAGPFPLESASWRESTRNRTHLLELAGGS